MTRQGAEASHLRLVTEHPRKGKPDHLDDVEWTLIVQMITRVREIAWIAVEEIDDNIAALDRDGVVAGLRRLVALSVLAQQAANELEDVPL